MVFVDYYKERKKGRSWLFVVSGILIFVASIILIVVSYIFIRNIKTKIVNEIELMNSEEKRLTTVTKLTNTIMKEIQYKREFLKNTETMDAERKQILETINNIVTLKISGYEIKEITLRDGVIKIKGTSYNNIIPAEYVSELKNFLSYSNVSLDKIKREDHNYNSIISIQIEEKTGGE